DINIVERFFKMARCDDFRYDCEAVFVSCTLQDFQPFEAETLEVIWRCTRLVCTAADQLLAFRGESGRDSGHLVVRFDCTWSENERRHIFAYTRTVHLDNGILLLFLTGDEQRFTVIVFLKLEC